jgi:hypothetical protein
MIPKVIHFVFGLREDFGKKPFGLPHYLAIKSAHDCNPDYQIKFHCCYVPSGEWWDKVVDLIEIIKVEAPTEVFGNPIYHVAHQADVVRMRILKDDGGIYLDMDTITVKSFDDLLHYPCVIGIEGKRESGLCNAVIMAQPGNRFMNEWYEQYRTFASTGRDSTWGAHSIKLPLKMWKSGEYNDSLKVLPYDAFHYPTWSKKGSQQLFEEFHLFPNAYCHHLWESINWRYLSVLTVEDIKNIDTSYNVIARKYI